MSTFHKCSQQGQKSLERREVVTSGVERTSDVIFGRLVDVGPCYLLRWSLLEQPKVAVEEYCHEYKS